MKHLLILFIFGLALLAGIVFSGCKDSDPTTTSAVSPGNITGFVSVYDTLYQPMSDNSGIVVSLDGTSLKTLSDSSGKWFLANVPPGMYTLVFSKDNYATRKVLNIQCSGNGTFFYWPGTTTGIYPIPNLYPDIVIRPFGDNVVITHVKDSVGVDTSGRQTTIHIYDTVVTKKELAIFSSRSQNRYHGVGVYNMIFFSTTENIDPKIPTSYFYTLSYGVQDTSGTTNFNISRTALLQVGFTSGSKIYCVVYSATDYSVIDWFDPATNREVFSGLSPHHSDVVSFILP